MTLFDESWFGEIRHPGRYIGEEIHSVRKNPSAVEVSIALAFPDVYEVGMSHLGLKILYYILNGIEWIGAERVYCPWADMEGELRARKLGLQAIESGRPIRQFDVVGFSLQHELTLSNVLTMLQLAGIPFLSEDRDLSAPLVIAGGPACFNPEPMALLFDAILIGDGEEAAVEICRKVREWKRGGSGSREDLLRALATLDGVYVPRFFDVSYYPGGVIERIQSNQPGRERIRKAVVSDIEGAALPAAQLVSHVGLVHDRLAIEISRGCTRGCRFCQAGMIYRPVRERNPQAVFQGAGEALRATGYEELSLLSLSSGDYTCLAPLLKSLMDFHCDQSVALSLPSLRVGSMDPAWFEEIKRVRKTGFTLAAEAGNDRLRGVINKGLTNREIVEMAGEVYRAGWTLIKLYFMVGLPQEGEEDVQDIVSLAKQVASQSRSKGGRPKLNVSISTFVPKSHTPFMWAVQIPAEESWRRIQKIRSALGGRIHVKWNLPRMSWLEGIFARGDRRLLPVLIEAWQRGARFDAWSEHFNAELWSDSFQKCGVDPDFYLRRERSLDEVLPWDHIDCGVRKSFLKREWERGLKGELTEDCRNRCHECGVCDHDRIDPVLHRQWIPPVRTELQAETGKGGKYRLSFTKLGKARYLSHLELVRLFTRAFRRAGLDLVHSAGFHPMPKLSFHSALPVGMESLDECLDIQLRRFILPEEIRERMNPVLPTGIRVVSVQNVAEEKKRPRLTESHFRVTLKGARPDDADLLRFMEAEYVPASKKGKEGEVVFNARASVISIKRASSNEILLVIGHHDGPQIRPAELLREVFKLDEETLRSVRVLKTGQKMEAAL